MNQGVIVIGPFKIGKSTVTRELHWKLDWPLHFLDAHPEFYFQQENFETIYPRGFTIWDQISSEFQPYNAIAVDRFFSEFSETEEDHIFDIGGTQSVYEDDKLLRRVEEIFVPYDVVLLLPSSDQERSMEFMRNRIMDVKRRRAKNWTDEQIDLVVKHGVCSSSNQRLAKIVVHTMNKTPVAIGDEICQRLNLI